METVLDDQSFPLNGYYSASNDTAGGVGLDVSPSARRRRRGRKLSQVGGIQHDSPIRNVVINSTAKTTTTTTTIRRQGHLMVLLPLTQSTNHELQQQRTLVESLVYTELAAFLAFQHLQHKSRFVLPRVQKRIQDCDFEMTYQHTDTQFSQLQAAKKLLMSMGIPLINNPTTRPQGGAQQQQQQYNQENPFAILGEALSDDTMNLATLTGALQLPQMSSSSTSSSLDSAPYFARTITTNKVDALALMTYMRLHLNLDHLGVLFLQDTWGHQYQQDLSLYAMRYNITLHSVPYQPLAMEKAMQHVRQTPVQFWIGIIDPNDWKPVVRAAYQWGVMGNPDYQWYLGDIVALRESSFVLDATTEQDLALALHGIGMPFWNIPKHAALERSLDTVAQDTQFLLDFIAHHDEPYLFDNFTFAKTPPKASLYQYLTYDAVMALGITACETPGRFTGEEFYNKLLEIDFEGVSGRVKFDPETGTRLADGVVFDIINLLLTTGGNGDTNSMNIVTFEARTSAMITLSSVAHNWTAHAENQGNGIPGIAIVKPFVFHNNGIDPPVALRPPEHDMNLIPPGVLALGILLGIFTMILSIGFAIWTMVHREAYVVRAAQPIFLITICVGTGIVSFTIIPLSFQEYMPSQLLDLGCLSIPWTICVGFTLAIASLYSKARRVNKVMQSKSSHGGKVIRRVRISPSDVIWPSFTLLHTDFGFLLAWTFSPFRLVWKRTFFESHVDSLGRQVESYGACRTYDGTTWYLLFLIPLCITKILVLVRVTYASYQGRHLPTEFGETKYLFLALLSLCETTVVGAIPLLAVMNDPTSFFMVASILIVMGCLSVLLPVFVPKYLQRHAQEPKRKTIVMMQAANINRSSWLQSGTLSEAECESHRSLARRNSSTFMSSNLSSFLASEPSPIHRVSAASSNSSKDIAPPTFSASDTLAAVGHAGYKLIKGPAVAAKAIMLAPFTSSLESMDDHCPHRLEALLEESEDDEAPADGLVGPIVELSGGGNDDVAKQQNSAQVSDPSSYEDNDWSRTSRREVVEQHLAMHEEEFLDEKCTEGP